MTLSKEWWIFIKISSFSFKNDTSYSKFPVEIIIKSLDCCRKSKSYGRKSACIPWRWFIRRGGTQATLPRFTRYDSFRWRYDYVIFQQCVTAQMNNYMTLNSNIQNRRRKKKIFKNVSVILNVSFQKLSLFQTKIAKFVWKFQKNWSFSRQIGQIWAKNGQFWTEIFKNYHVAVYFWVC